MVSKFLNFHFELLRNNFYSVSSYHVTYAFQSESTLYSCLIVKELFARSRREIWSLSDCSWTRIQKHLVVNEHSIIWENWPNDWAVLWVLICTVHLTVSSYNVTYCSHVNFRFLPCFEQEVPWHSGSYRVFYV